MIGKLGKGQLVPPPKKKKKVRLKDNEVSGEVEKFISEASVMLFQIGNT